MSSLHTLRTVLLLSIGGCGEHEVAATVSYWFTKAWPESHDDPGSPATVEIDNIQIVQDGDYHKLPRWMADLFSQDDVLLDECMEDYVAGDIAAREAAAESRREDAMLAARAEQDA